MAGKGKYEAQQPHGAVHATPQARTAQPACRVPHQLPAQ